MSDSKQIKDPLLTRADKIRAHMHKADRAIHSMTDQDEINGYLECANLFARLEIAAQLAELNTNICFFIETEIQRGESQ